MSGASFISTGHRHMTGAPGVILLPEVGSQPPMVSIDFGEFEFNIRSAADGRMAIAAIAQGVALLEEAAGPSPWNGILKEEAR